MAGRGFSLKPFKIKDDESDTQSVTSTSSTALLLQGRGRSLSAFAPRLTQTVPTVPVQRTGPFDPARYKNDSDEEEPVARGSSGGDQQSVAGSSTLSFSMGRGRGIFALPMRPSGNIIPSPVSSQTKSKEATSSGISGGRPESPVVTPSSGASLDTEKTAILKHGKKGMPITACTNAIPIHCNPEAGVFEYEVRFNPPVDSPKFRSRYLMQHKELIGNAKTFDGVMLYLPFKLPDEVTNLVSESQDDQSDINVKIMFKRQKRLGDCIQLYNILFDKIYKVLNYRKF